MRYLLLPALCGLLTAGLISAAEPVVLCEDSFTDKLDANWTWLRENPDTWRLKDGALEICVEPGKAHDVKNALVRTAPDRTKTKFAVEVTVTFTTEPTQQFEQAGITWYHQQKPVFKLVHEQIDGSQWIIPGRKPAPAKTVQLRLIVDGVDWTAQYREDAEGEFLTAGTGKLPPPGEDQVSLQCYNGPADAKHWIRFDDFRIIELAE